MRKQLVLAVVLCVAAGGSVGFAQPVRELAPFSPDDRVLIMAPHPDDETMGTGGVIQRALKSGARVRVVCYTNGDHNEFSFIVYEKRLTFRTGEFLHMGEVRRHETIAAMASVGVPAQDVVFLGYPDFGTLAILLKHWQDTKPYWSLMTRISYVEYPEALSPGAPYEGESILHDIEAVIEDFRPTKIFVSHPADTNRDHQSLYLFTRIALWDLDAKIAQPKVYPFLIHVVGWPKPRGHHADLALDPPLKIAGVSWEKVSLSKEEAGRKHDLIDYYPSQIEYNPPYLYTYARSNELFGDFPTISLEANRKTPELKWHTVVQPPASARIGPADADEEALFSDLAYSLKENNLFIRLKLRRSLDKSLGISIDLLGYSRRIAFAAMPKLNISLGFFGMRVRDKGRPVVMPEILRMKDGKNLIIQVPLENLGQPRFILSRVRSRVTRLPLDEGSWRIIEIR
ncbi:MAG: PIG-L family deacetylase [Candidatus Omnitrophica bacterium]|nr:PIG-L family deacetylase [Candidatus Omnitrophota bacterium]